jgi:hypothetical protein
VNANNIRKNNVKAVAVYLPVRAGVGSFEIVLKAWGGTGVMGVQVINYRELGSRKGKGFIEGSVPDLGGGGCAVGSIHGVQADAAVAKMTAAMPHEHR